MHMIMSVMKCCESKMYIAVYSQQTGSSTGTISLEVLVSWFQQIDSPPKLQTFQSVSFSFRFLSFFQSLILFVLLLVPNILKEWTRKSFFSHGCAYGCLPRDLQAAMYVGLAAFMVVNHVTYKQLCSFGRMVLYHVTYMVWGRSLF